MNNNNLTSPLIQPKLSNKLGILFLTFIVMIIAVGLMKGILDVFIPDARVSFLVASVQQSVLAFVMPAWLMAFLCYTAPSRFLGISTPVAAREFVGVLIIMCIIMPAMNLIIDWNANISLPESMSALEKTMRGWEDTAADMTAMILGDASLTGLISNLIVVGIITGFAEECFFRAGIQKALTTSGVNMHVAVWVVAFIFSTFHFQFFGFVPRMLLGALFGYIYFSSDSLWVSASAHALNNSIVVVTAWLTSRGFLNFNIELFGVEGSGALLWASASLVTTIVFVVLLWGKCFSAPKRFN